MIRRQREQVVHRRQQGVVEQGVEVGFCAFLACVWIGRTEDFPDVGRFFQAQLGWQLVLRVQFDRLGCGGGFGRRRVQAQQAVDIYFVAILWAFRLERVLRLGRSGRCVRLRDDILGRNARQPIEATFGAALCGGYGGLLTRGACRFFVCFERAQPIGRILIQRRGQCRLGIRIEPFDEIAFRFRLSGFRRHELGHPLFEHLIGVVGGHFLVKFKLGEGDVFRRGDALGAGEIHFFVVGQFRLDLHAEQCREVGAGLRLGRRFRLAAEQRIKVELGRAGNWWLFCLRLFRHQLAAKQCGEIDFSFGFGLRLRLGCCGHFRCLLRRLNGERLRRFDFGRGRLVIGLRRQALERAGFVRFFPRSRV